MLEDIENISNSKMQRPKSFRKVASAKEELCSGEMKLKINRRQILTIPSHIYFRVIDGRVVILDVKNKYFHRLNKIGSVIFRCIKKKKNIEEIGAILHESFKVSRNVATKDCIDFISMLVKKRILIRPEEI